LFEHDLLVGGHHPPVKSDTDRSVREGGCVPARLAG
jgi:hypothetical protein